MRCNLGCGKDLRPGWLNIDASYPFNIPKGIDYLEWDLRHGLPDQVQNVEVFAQSHMAEHLTWEDNIKLYKSCRERMVVGGTLFIEIPDFRSVVKAYLENDWTYFNCPEIMNFCKGLTLSSLVDYALHQRVNSYPEHISFLDEESMLYILGQAGFTNVYRASYEDKEKIANPEPLRRKYSIYFKAIK